MQQTLLSKDTGPKKMLVEVTVAVTPMPETRVMKIGGRAKTDGLLGEEAVRSTSLTARCCLPL